jgi:hypothetical protein
VIDVLNHRLKASPIGTVHSLAKVVPTITRSQLYRLLGGHGVIDMAEFFAICVALGVSPQQVIGEADRVSSVGAPGPEVAGEDEATASKAH